MPLRRYAPRSGPAYELFDAGIFLFLLGLVGYVLTTPPAVSRDALAEVFDVARPVIWGIGLCITGCVAVGCSYYRDHVRQGLTLVKVVCIFWGLCFAVGGVIYCLRFGPDHTIMRTVLSVVLYGWIASRMGRETARWDQEQAIASAIRGRR